ncbi:MAG: hypothetical protein ACTHZD_10585 [Micrococcaceae bacterium]
MVPIITPLKEGIMRTFTKLLGTGLAALGLAAGLSSATAAPAEAKTYEYTYTNRTLTLEGCRSMLQQDIRNTNMSPTMRVSGYKTCAPANIKVGAGEPRGYEYTFSYFYW